MTTELCDYISYLDDRSMIAHESMYAVNCPDWVEATQEAFQELSANQDLFSIVKMWDTANKDIHGLTTPLCLYVRVDINDGRDHSDYGDVRFICKLNHKTKELMISSGTNISVTDGEIGLAVCSALRKFVSHTFESSEEVVKFPSEQDKKNLRSKQVVAAIRSLSYRPSTSTFRVENHGWPAAVLLEFEGVARIISGMSVSLDTDVHLKRGDKASISVAVSLEEEDYVFSCVVPASGTELIVTYGPGNIIDSCALTAVRGSLAMFLCDLLQSLPAPVTFPGSATISGR